MTTTTLLITAVLSVDLAETQIIRHFRNGSILSDVGNNGSGDDIKEGGGDGGGGHGSSKSASEMNGDGGSKPKMKMNAHFMKKLPKGAEASNILVRPLFGNLVNSSTKVVCISLPV